MQPAITSSQRRQCSHCMPGESVFLTRRLSTTQVAELLQLQKRSPDGVITLDNAAWNKYIAGRSRPYSLVVFSSATHLLDKPNLRLRDLRAEFGYMAKGYRADAGTHGKVRLASTCASQHSMMLKVVTQPRRRLMRLTRSSGATAQVFPVEIEYMRTGEVFSRLPTKSLPYIFHVGPQFSVEGDGPLKLMAADVMQVRASRQQSSSCAPPERSVMTLFR